MKAAAAVSCADVRRSFGKRAVYTERFACEHRPRFIVCVDGNSEFLKLFSLFSSIYCLYRIVPVRTTRSI